MTRNEKLIKYIKTYTILLSHISSFPFALYIILLNIPFLYLGSLQIGRSFAFATIHEVHDVMSGRVKKRSIH